MQVDVVLPHPREAHDVSDGGSAGRIAF
eukprot:COSAG01_NODE_61769_length_288_cov_0.396825_1_plen_27_part_10